MGDNSEGKHRKKERMHAVNHGVHQSGGAMNIGNLAIGRDARATSSSNTFSDLSLSELFDDLRAQVSAVTQKSDSQSLNTRIVELEKKINSNDKEGIASSLVAIKNESENIAGTTENVLKILTTLKKIGAAAGLAAGTLASFF